LEEKVYQYKKENEVFRKDNTKLAMIVKQQSNQIVKLNESFEEQFKQLDIKAKFM